MPCDSMSSNPAIARSSVARFGTRTSRLMTASLSRAAATLGQPRESGKQGAVKAVDAALAGGGKIRGGAVERRWTGSCRAGAAGVRSSTIRVEAGVMAASIGLWNRGHSAATAGGGDLLRPAALSALSRLDAAVAGMHV